MEISLSHEPSEFLEKSFHFLGKHEAENCLMLSLLDRLKAHKHLFSEENPRFFTLEDGPMKSVAMQTPPYNLILSHPFKKEAVHSLISFLKEKNIQIPGIIGSKETVSYFSQNWEKVFKVSSNIAVYERIYRLDHVEPKTLNSSQGQFSQATVEDIDLILKWMHQFNLEACPEDDSESYKEFVANQRAPITEALKDGQYYFLKDQNQHVCMARSPGKTVNGRIINYVYTPEKFRRHGYATTCVARLSQKILDDGYTYCSLFTDLSNPVSNSIYQQIGYRPVDDVNLIKFSSSV